jgi:hypothetical protein
MEEWTAIRIEPVLFMMENVNTIKISGYIYMQIWRGNIILAINEGAYICIVGPKEWFVA